MTYVFHWILYYNKQSFQKVMTKVMYYEGVTDFYFNDDWQTHPKTDFYKKLTYKLNEN